MKFILAGSTGYIGGEVLKQCLDDPRISLLVILSRRQLPNVANNPKAKVVILKDFSDYPESVATELDGADACLWAVGTYSGDTTVEVEYPATFFTTLTSRPNYKGRTTPFRNVYLGGGLTEPDQGKSLWFLSAARKGRGSGQAKVLSFTKEPAGRGLWESIVVRPMWVMSPQAWFQQPLRWILGQDLCVAVEEVAAAMIELAVNGSKHDLVANREIVQIGRDRLQ